MTGGGRLFTSRSGFMTSVAVTSTGRFPLIVLVPCEGAAPRGLSGDHLANKKAPLIRLREWLMGTREHHHFNFQLVNFPPPWYRVRVAS